MITEEKVAQYRRKEHKTLQYIWYKRKGEKYERENKN